MKELSSALGQCQCTRKIAIVADTATLLRPGLSVHGFSPSFNHCVSVSGNGIRIDIFLQISQCDHPIDVQNILKQNLEKVKAVSYVVPVHVEVFSNEPVLMNGVAMFLSKTIQLFLNKTAHGNGPGSSLVLPQIE